MPQMDEFDNVAFNVRYSNCEKRTAVVNQTPYSIGWDNITRISL
jgi:hypothetical protein